MTLSPYEWERVVDSVSGAPTAGAVAAALAETDIYPHDDADAWEAVNDALEAGVLAEVDTGGTFLEIIVQGSESPVDDETQSGSPTPDGESLASPPSPCDDSHAREAFTAAIEFFHTRLDDDLATDVVDVTTAREYFVDDRGWSTETVETKQLGYAPADLSALLDHLMRRGFDRDAILGTGLFWENGLSPIWRGRLVFPYLVDGRPAFAISRRLGEAGHPSDRAGAYDGGTPAKYHKIPGQDCSVVDEPIFGLDTIRDGEAVLITEGIADAITAHEAGYPCVSPVTTSFKHDDREALVDALTDRDVQRVYIVQDAERPSSSIDDEGRLSLAQYGPGLKGAVATGAYLATDATGLDVRLAELPRPGLDKVDLDDYLRGWSDTLAPILASAKPATAHPAYDAQSVAIDTARRELHRSASATTVTGDGEQSALFALDIRDVTGLPWDYRGTNPLGHHGDSMNYFVLIEDHGVAYDHKHKAAYTPLTFLLCEAGERHPGTPNGTLDDREVFVAWRQSKRRGIVSDDDPIPHRALRHVAIDAGHCTAEDIEDGWRLPVGAYNDALATVEGTHGVNPGRTPLGGGLTVDGERYGLVECEPPAFDPKPFDREQQWEAFQGPLYDEYLDAGRPTIFAHPPGTGKTTNAANGAARRGRKHAVLFDQHRKAREHQLDDATPDRYVHLRGAEQKREAACMDADHAEEDCPDHGHGSCCPSMCPIYDRARDDPERQAFDAVANEVGPVRAHLLLDPHDGDECPYLGQFDGLESAERVVGVKEYMTLKTLQANDRDIIIDEKPGAPGKKRTMGVEDLVRTGNFLGRLGEIHTDKMADNFAAFAAFADRLVDALTDPDATSDLGGIDPPNIVWEPHSYIDIQDPLTGKGPKRTLYAETLAKLKVEYSETLIARIASGDGWDRTPLCFDSLLLAAGAAGLRDDAVRQAVAGPAELDVCPRCHSEMGHDNGARVCLTCGWHERHDTILDADAEKARGLAHFVHDESGVPIGLFSRVLPLDSELPDAPLILDATATPDVVEGLFGQKPLVLGDEAVETNMHVTQVVNGQYHKSTLTGNEKNMERVQRVIDTAAAVHEQVLVVSWKSIRSDLELPANVEWLHYHAARGLNRADCDAVVTIGAPHPRMDDLRDDAELLAMDCDHLRVGGDEHSTRRDAPNPPVYRKFYYRDDDGRGRAIPTKHYTGLTGARFREEREDELEQVVHRLRPVLAEETKFVYMVTNVPTDVPIDELATFEELADPLRATLPVPDGALSLLEYVYAAFEGDGPDGFRAETLVDVTTVGGETRAEFNKRAVHRLSGYYGMNVTYRTVSEWVNSLGEIGLLDAGEYAFRSGVGYSVSLATLKSALQILSGNTGFKVAARRLLCQNIAEATSATEWLRWAREMLKLTARSPDGDPGEKVPG